MTALSAIRANLLLVGVALVFVPQVTIAHLNHNVPAEGVRVLAQQTR